VIRGSPVEDLHRQEVSHFVSLIERTSPSLKVPYWATPEWALAASRTAPQLLRVAGDRVSHPLGRLPT
jgi:hypothetical protein